MPRDANGNYTLPAGNPVIPGTSIDTTWANPTMQDLGIAMTDSLSRSGDGGMLVAFQNVDGTVGTPGMTWTAETITGFYRALANDMRVSVGGVDKFRWTATAVQVWDATAGQWNNVVTENQIPDTFVDTVFGRTGDVIGELADYSADLVTYDNTTSGLAAIEVQAAIDEVNSDVNFIESSYVSTFNGRTGVVVPVANDYTALQVFADNTQFDIITATNVQVALEELEELIQLITGGTTSRGAWNADTNVPDLLTIAKDSGDYWWVTVAGNTPLPDGDGGFITTWEIGDRALYVDVTLPSPFTGFVRIVNAGALVAANVLFDDTNFVASFPTAPPIDNVQQGLDFGWPILANADESNVGKDAAAFVPQDADTANNDTLFGAFTHASLPNINQFFGFSTMGTNTGLQLVARENFGLFWRDAFVNDFSEIFNSTTRTNAEANASLDLADTALQSGANVSELVNDVPYLISADLAPYLPLTGGTVSGQIKGITPVDIDDLTRKDYVDALLSGGVTSFNARTGVVIPVAADYTPAFIGAATAAQGALADSATQPLDNISTLTNDSAYITAANVPVATSTTFGGFKYTFDGTTLNLITV